MKTPFKAQNMVFAPLLLLSLVAPSALAGYEDQRPPLPQPNDIDGTVHGCADAIVSFDLDQDGAIRRDEYLGFVNQVADLLCLPPRPILDLELNSVFVGIACLCQEQEGNNSTCCFGDQAGLYQDGAANSVGRTEEQLSYLRAACVWTQTVLGPQQCLNPDATLAPEGLVAIRRYDPLRSSPSQFDLFWLLLLLLLPLSCVVCCCCYSRGKKVEEEYEITVEEHRTAVGPHKSNDVVDIPAHNIVEEACFEFQQDSKSIGYDNPEPWDTIQVGDSEGGFTYLEPPLGPFGLDMEEDIAPGRDNAEYDAEIGGKKEGASVKDVEDEESGRAFKGQGQLPYSPPFDGIKLRHVATEKEITGDYDYIQRDLHENHFKGEDSGERLDHYEPDGGVYDPQRPPREPIIMPKPQYQRKPKPEPVHIDPREQRMQKGLGDGAVWEALDDWEEPEEETGRVHIEEWIVTSMLDAFADAEEAGDLEKERSSEDDLTGGEDEEDQGSDGFFI